jgi:hypothetical protein
MAKKLIRLTESDLHNIIKESVNNILSELDWKTYANAAKKRAEQGRHDDANKLIDAANKSIRNKYTNTQDAHDWKGFGNGASLNAYINQDGGTIEDQRSSWDGDRRNFGKRATETHKFNNNGSYSKTLSGTGDSNMGNRSQTYMNTLNRMGNDMQRYYSGESKYTKGKGWDS